MFYFAERKCNDLTLGIRVKVEFENYLMDNVLKQFLEACQLNERLFWDLNSEKYE